jgi:murein DD-endopeptidase MepM/ murein hydrolase activator NlpD
MQTSSKTIFILFASMSLALTLLSTPTRAQDATPTPPIETAVLVDPNAQTPAPDEISPTPDPTLDPALTPSEAPTAQIEVVRTPEPTAPPVEPTPVVDSRARVVQVGESLYTLAAQSGFSVNDLAQRNKLTHANLLLTGQQIALPETPETTIRLHRVLPGETLTSIAAENNVSPYLLRQTNGLACSACLVVGQIIRVPVNEVAGNLPEPFGQIRINPSLPTQGDVIVISVTTRAPLQSLIGTLAGRPLNFVQKDGAYLALSGVGAVQETGVYTITLRATTLNGEPSAVTGRFQVGAGRFGFEQLTLAPKLVPLLDLDVNREERSALDNLFAKNFTGAQYWQGAFAYPINGKLVSFFGTRRNFNRGTLETFHSGIDLSARLGTPIKAAAPGKVIATSKFPIRGNVVILDHGRGVFTLYCHMLRFNVKVGDLVNTGDTIGFTGNTGRSLGPHLHWEMAVGGVTVNPLVWLEKTLP